MTTRLDKLPLSKMVPVDPRARDCELKVVRPAQATGTKKALRALESVSRENKLGSHRPSKLLTALNPEKSRLYFMPVVASDDPDALEVAYNDSSFDINLYAIFQSLDRLVPSGIREVYPLEVAPELLEISGVVGKALFITLGSPEKETIKQMSPEALAKRRATIARKKQAAATKPTIE